MNIRIRLLSLFLLLSFFSRAQTGKKFVFDFCNLGSFCNDCGDPKASYKDDLNIYFRNEFHKDDIKDLNEIILVQVLIDTFGTPCIKSISNYKSERIPKLNFEFIINKMKGWSPAMSNGKAENTSVTLQFIFRESNLFVSYFRAENSEPVKKKSVNKVEITNRNKLSYSLLAKIQGKVFTTGNSILPHNMARAICIDNENIIWLGTNSGLVKMQNTKMSLIKTQDSTTLSNFNKFNMTCADVDTDNNKWFTNGSEIYKYNGKNWEQFDSTNIPIKLIHGIYADKFGAVWFTSTGGLIKYSDNKWTIWTTNNSKLKSNNISGVFVDSKKRTWIGTFEGNILIDQKFVEDFQGEPNPLKHASILKGMEDSKGNIWFSLYSSDNINSGLAKYSALGVWTMYNILNSGLPSREILDFTIDKNNTIWLSMNGVGLTKFDGNNWEIFTPENSVVPSTIIPAIAFDKTGTLWCATFAGLLEIIKH